MTGCGCNIFGREMVLFTAKATADEKETICYLPIDLEVLLLQL